MPGKKLSIMLPVDLARQIRERVKTTPGLTVTSVIESAVRRSLARLEGQHGGPFPARLGSLLTGRPLSGKNSETIQRTVITTYTGAELQDRLRNALYWTRSRLFVELEREIREELAKPTVKEPKYRRKSKEQLPATP